MAQSNQNVKKTKKRKNRKEEGSKAVIRDWESGDRLLAPVYGDMPYEEPDKEIKRLEKKLGNKLI